MVRRSQNNIIGELHAYCISIQYNPERRKPYKLSVLNYPTLGIKRTGNTL